MHTKDGVGKSSFLLIDSLKQNRVEDAFAYNKRSKTSLSTDISTGGFPVEWFLVSANENLICSYCQKVLNNPQTGCCCGHTFCESCITHSLNLKQCPECKEHISLESSTSVVSLKCMIDILIVKCGNFDSTDGCTWTGQLCQRQEHLTEHCMYEIVNCVFCQPGSGCPVVGCEKGKVLRKLHIAHKLSIKEDSQKNNEPTLSVSSPSMNDVISPPSFSSIDSPLTSPLTSPKSRRRELKALENGVLYTGMSPDPVSQRHKGTLQFTDLEENVVKAVYYGDLWYYTPHGVGIKRYASGAVYEGEWVNGNFTGAANKVTYADGTMQHKASTAEGVFLNGRLNGIGKTVTCNGKETYEGNFADDKRHGEGTCTHAGVWSYCGQYERGAKHGRGKYILIGSNQTYEGQYKHNKMHGRGVITHGDDSTFMGTFVKDKKHGRDV